MSESQIFVGIGLIVALAVGCQVVAAKARIPAIILLLPVGFAAGNLISSVNPEKLLGDAFTPLVSIAVAIILFDGGLDLSHDNLLGDDRKVVNRLRSVGVAITWFGGAVFALVLLGLSSKAAIMLGAILIVSGPTVVTPLLEAARPGKRLTAILGFEGTTVDPIGAMVAVVVFQYIQANHEHGVVDGAVGFVGRIGIGLVFGAVGVAVLWLLLGKLGLRGLLGTEVILATVVAVAALSDSISSDTGLVAAISMGIVIANMRGVHVPEDRPFLKTVVQLNIGILFIAISATVTPESMRGVVWPTLALIACLVLIVRPVVALVATFRTNLTRPERIFVGAMDPRGIVAASTAATFSASLITLGIDGADKLLPVTFLVIVGTVTIYGLGAVPFVKALKLGGDEPEIVPEVDPSSATALSDGTDAPTEAPPREPTVD
jgi:NhaP-type Na+/H+ or K+/H+ antiporter